MMIKVLVLLIGGLAIAYSVVVLRKHAIQRSPQCAMIWAGEVEVKGGYSPEQIVLKKGFRRYLILRAKMHLVVWTTSS